MLYEISKYGGIITIALSWLTLILPFLLLRKRLKIKLISQVVEKSSWGLITKMGVLVCGIAQILFAYYLYLNFIAPTIRFGIVLYGVGSLSFFLCGLVDYYPNTKLHRFFVEAYYLWMTVGFTVISIEFTLFSKITALLLIIFPLYYFLVRRKEIVAEFLVIILSNIYALGLYSYLGVLR